MSFEEQERFFLQHDKYNLNFRLEMVKARQYDLTSNLHRKFLLHSTQFLQIKDQILHQFHYEEIFYNSVDVI